MAVPPAVVTAIVFAPTDPAGVFAVIEVSDAITTLVAAIPPTVTLLAPVKLVPVIEIAVPAASNPEGGSTNVIVGAATYVNAPPTVSIPPGVVTETACEPAIPLGVTAVIEVDEITLRVVAATPPKVTRFAPVKLVPVIVTVVPAVSGPNVGLIKRIFGAATYVNALVFVIGPPTTVVTETSFAPAVFAGVFAVIEVEETTTTFVAAIPPIKTLLASVKLVPVIVIVVPAVSGPEVGVTEVIDGGAI